MATPAKKVIRPEDRRATGYPSTPPLAPLPPTEPPYLLEVPRRHRRAYLLAFLVSAALHLIAVLLYPLLVERGGAPGTTSVPIGMPRPQGIEVVVIREVADGAAPEPEQRPAAGRAPAIAPRAPAAPPVSPDAAAGGGAPGMPSGPPGAAVGGAAGATGGGTPAERLRPGIPDLRIWTLDPKFTQLTADQIVKLELLWTIIDMNASAAAAAAAARALSDWTYTDEEGKRWGVADGKVYLGDLVLPFPFSFGAPPNSDAAQKAWIDAEIDRAAGSAAARENLDQRIKAIRQRIEQERRRLRNDSTRVPPKP